jgi:ABC-type transport system involved in multi-copper enzyme maturation permease subunit
VIRELARKEYVQRKALFAIAYTLVLLLTAVLPFFFAYSLQHAMTQRANDTAELILRNFRSYANFVEAQWCARSLPRILSLLALIGGAGALAGERENHTWRLLSRSSASAGTIVGVKYGVLAVWLLAVVVASTIVLAVHGAIAHQPFPLIAISVTSLLAFATSLAFLGVVFAASAFVSRAAVAAALALVAGFALAGVLLPFGFNATAFAADLIASDGSLNGARAAVELAMCAAIAAAGVGLAVWRSARNAGT